MSTTTRDKLIAAARAEFARQAVEDRQHDIERLVDVVLDTLREPDEGMIAAGAILDEWVQNEGQSPQPHVFTAMIDHVRKG